MFTPPVLPQINQSTNQDNNKDDDKGILFLANSSHAQKIIKINKLKSSLGPP
jgi:hypothetical protein